MKEEMKELHTEGVASHGGPKPCGGPRERAVEALAGVRAGGAIEPRNGENEVPTPLDWWKATPLAAPARAAEGPRGVEEPMHARNLHAREPGDPIVARLPRSGRGRSGKAGAASLR